MDNHQQDTDRVREVSSSKISQEIDQEIRENLAYYKGMPKEVIAEKIQALNREWDVERNIEVYAPTLILGGLLLGYFVNKKWLALSGVVAASLLQHGLQGWCPPVAALRAMKIRTKGEIDKEKYGLKALKGDFDGISSDKNPAKVIEAVSS